MQLARAASVALAISSLLATPVLAGNSKAQKVEAGEDAAPTCSSYQLGPDGNWAPVSCQELGTHSSSQHRTPPKDHREEAH